MTTYYAVRNDVYTAALSYAKGLSPRIDANTSYPEDESNVGRYFMLDYENTSGYFLEANGERSYELRGVFSTVKGKGADILGHACSMADAAGAMLTLNCYDGYLVSLYGRYGFVEVAREANWTPGQPDVVYMARYAM